MLHFIINLPTIHQRWMMKYLRKRGWVVFYLDDAARTCNNGVCWLNLYKQSEDIKINNHPYYGLMGLIVKVMDLFFPEKKRGKDDLLE